MKPFVVFFLLVLNALVGAAPIKVLQVEESRDGFRPDPQAIPGVKIIDASPAYEPGQYSGHATDVARRLCASGFVAELEIDHATFYSGRDGLGINRTNPPGEPIWPKPARGWRLENHSYGRMVSFGMAEALARLDERIVRENIVVVVGVPNAGQGYALIFDQPAPRLLFSGAQNVIAVGSFTGDVDLLPGGRVDLVSLEQYSSYGAPTVAAVCAELISMALDAGYAYTWREIRDVLKTTADPRGDPVRYGAGTLNRGRAVEAWRQRIAPPVVITPPPPSVRGQCEAIARSTGWRCKRTVSVAGEKFCWQHKP